MKTPCAHTRLHQMEQVVCSRPRVGRRHSRRPDPFSSDRTCGSEIKNLKKILPGLDLRKQGQDVHKLRPGFCRTAHKNILPSRNRPDCPPARDYLTLRAIPIKLCKRPISEENPFMRCRGSRRDFRVCISSSAFSPEVIHPNRKAPGMPFAQMGCRISRAH